MRCVCSFSLECLFIGNLVCLIALPHTHKYTPIRNGWQFVVLYYACRLKSFWYFEFLGGYVLLLSRINIFISTIKTIFEYLSQVENTFIERFDAYRRLSCLNVVHLCCVYVVVVLRSRQKGEWKFKPLKQHFKRNCLQFANECCWHYYYIHKLGKANWQCTRQRHSIYDITWEYIYIYIIWL